MKAAIPITQFAERFEQLKGVFKCPGDPIWNRAQLARALSLDQSALNRYAETGWSHEHFTRLLELTGTSSSGWTCPMEQLPQRIRDGLVTLHSSWDELISRVKPAPRDQLRILAVGNKAADGLRAAYISNAGKQWPTIPPNVSFQIQFSWKNDLRYAVILGRSLSGWQSLCPSGAKEDERWDVAQRSSIFPNEPGILGTNSETGPHEIIVAQSELAFPRSIIRELRNHGLDCSGLNAGLLHGLYEFFRTDRELSTRRLLRLRYSVDATSNGHD